MSPIQCLFSRSAKWTLAASWALAAVAAQAQPVAAPAPQEAAAPAPQAAADPVVVSGPAGQVTLSEIEILVNDMVPAAQREAFWSNPQSVERFARSLYAQRALAADAVQAGLDKSGNGAEYLNLIRERALMTLWLQHSGQAAVPDDKALEAYARSEYKAKPERFTTPEEVRASHILIPVAKDGSDDAEAKAKAEALLAELRNGADFEKLAKENSSDKGSAARGGDLGFFPRGKMVPEFDKAVFELKKIGDLAGPVKTTFGYHILKLTDRKPASTKTFEEVLPTLKEEAATQLDGQARRRAWDAADAGAQVDDAGIKALVERHAAQH
jgi:peptidyl-prolyl cis-trans isomerase C